MEFHVYETGETVRARHRPVVIITSNNEKELPDAFLRRCFFHYIRFPDAETLEAIVEVHFPGIKDGASDHCAHPVLRAARDAGAEEEALDLEVLDWLNLLLAEDLAPEDLRREGKTALPKLHGAFLKNEQDVHLFERLAFIARSGR